MWIRTVILDRLSNLNAHGMNLDGNSESTMGSVQNGKHCAFFDMNMGCHKFPFTKKTKETDSRFKEKSWKVIVK